MFPCFKGVENTVEVYMGGYSIELAESAPQCYQCMVCTDGIFVAVNVGTQIIEY